jgi:hypothetical protein
MGKGAPLEQPATAPRPFPMKRAYSGRKLRNQQLGAVLISGRGFSREFQGARPNWLSRNA